VLSNKCFTGAPWQTERFRIASTRWRLWFHMSSIIRGSHLSPSSRTTSVISFRPPVAGGYAR